MSLFCFTIPQHISSSHVRKLLWAVIISPPCPGHAPGTQEGSGNGGPDYWWPWWKTNNPKAWIGNGMGTWNQGSLEIEHRCLLSAHVNREPSSNRTAFLPGRAFPRAIPGSPPRDLLGPPGRRGPLLRLSVPHRGRVGPPGVSPLVSSKLAVPTPARKPVLAHFTDKKTEAQNGAVVCPRQSTEKQPGQVQHQCPSPAQHWPHDSHPRSLLPVPRPLPLN